MIKLPPPCGALELDDGLSVPIALGKQHQPARLRDRGVIDDDIDAPVFLYDGIDHLLHGRIIGDVAKVRLGFPALYPDGLRGRLGVAAHCKELLPRLAREIVGHRGIGLLLAVVGDDDGALFGKELGNAAADALSRTRDERHFSL